MQIRYPEYYGKFHCLAGDCPDTCCVGWEIRVDQASRKRYRDIRKTDSDLGRRLRKYVRNGRIVPIHGKCPFLDEKGLCGIILKLGEHAVCRTCRSYPRHREDYGKLQEVLLLLSCPEAARLVLTEKPDQYRIREFPDRAADTEGIDGELLKALLEVRAAVREIGLECTAPFSLRMKRALALAHDVQRRLRNGKPEEIPAVTARYRKDREGKQFADQAEKWPERFGKREPEKEGLARFFLLSDFMEGLAELDEISPDWPKMLENSRKLLYHSKDSRSRYRKERERFWAENPELEQKLERIFAYFIYSFFLSALYDGDVYGKVKMAVFCTWTAEELMLASWRMDTDKKLWDSDLAAPGLEEQVKICHTFARQIENSDENRGRIEQILKRPEFRFRYLMNRERNPL